MEQIPIFVQCHVYMCTSIIHVHIDFDLHVHCITLLMVRIFSRVAAIESPLSQMFMHLVIVGSQCMYSGQTHTRTHTHTQYVLRMYTESAGYLRERTRDCQ